MTEQEKKLLIMMIVANELRHSFGVETHSFIPDVQNYESSFFEKFGSFIADDNESTIEQMKQIVVELFEELKSSIK